jgi:hypothetical protein
MPNAKRIEINILHKLAGVLLDSRRPTQHNGKSFHKLLTIIQMLLHDFSALGRTSEYP